jgi:hydroxymethylglutaryl-CoA lyase
MSTPQIKIVEVGPRDGLQNEKNSWTVEDRVQLINYLTPCGFDEIEVGSFVSPIWVPQMADTDLVFQRIEKSENCRYSTLVPNQKGMEAAIIQNVRNISIFTAASETFNKKNINCSIEESFERFKPLMAEAKGKSLRVRGYVSCAIECPYAGPVPPEKAAEVAERLWQMGCTEISLGDTIGKGTPETTVAMIKAVSKRLPANHLAIHCHDTYGRAIDNIEAAIENGVSIIDSAITGLGGCPYGGAQAKGNVATELVLAFLNRKNLSHTLNAKAIEVARQFVLNR